MLWFALALGSALTQAFQFAVVKSRARHIPPLVLIFWTQTVSLGVWIVYYLATGARVSMPLWMIGWILASVAGAAAMSYLLVRASAGGDISIVGPVLALSPVFAIVPDLVMTGTLPHGLGWVGLALSLVGTISLSRARGRGLALADLVRRDDAACAFGAAVVLGILSGIDRHNALAVGVPAYLLSLHATLWLGCGALVLLRRRRAFAATLAPATLAAVLAHAVLVTAGTILLMIAMTLAPAAYVNSVRRSGAVVSVVLGHTLFDEPEFAGRLAGGALTVVGAACLLLAR